MNREILDIPFRDSFSDFLDKGETIVWKDSAIELKYVIGPIRSHSLQFSRNEQIIIFITTMLPFVYFFFYEELGKSNMVLTPLVIFSIFIYFFSGKYNISDAVEFAISTKRILIKSNHSKQRIIYEIPFSQLSNCTVEEKKSGRGTILLALKNPNEIQFETFTIKDKGEIEKRYQPTLENIEDPQAVAKLIREGIKKSNSAS
ncbi:MAG: hypothetical protein AB8H03_21760 [Saprospiraceae bacterium]